MVRNTKGHKKARFLVPVCVSDWRRSKASPPKMTQQTAVPGRKVFAELFSKSDRPAPAGAKKEAESISLYVI